MKIRPVAQSSPRLFARQIGGNAGGDSLRNHSRSRRILVAHHSRRQEFMAGARYSSCSAMGSASLAASSVARQSMYHWSVSATLLANASNGGASEGKVPVWPCVRHCRLAQKMQSTM
jgi:hypothetical protein